jgi:hypothetical protein
VQVTPPTTYPSSFFGKNIPQYPYTGGSVCPSTSYACTITGATFKNMHFANQLSEGIQTSCQVRPCLCFCTSSAKKFRNCYTQHYKYPILSTPDSGHHTESENGTRQSIPKRLIIEARVYTYQINFFLDSILTENCKNKWQRSHDCAPITTE